MKKIKCYEYSYGTIFTTLNFLQLSNGSNKLECCVVPDWNIFPGAKTLAYWAHFYYFDMIDAHLV
jgi:hypothetical protein